MGNNWFEIVGCLGYYVYIFLVLFFSIIDVSSGVNDVLFFSMMVFLC